MKLRYNILVMAVAVIAVVACTNESELIDFKSDVNTIEVAFIRCVSSRVTSGLLR